jgi:hypothetical protein
VLGDAAGGGIDIKFRDGVNSVAQSGVDSMNLDGLSGHTSDRRELSGSVTCCPDRRGSVRGDYERNFLFRTFRPTSNRSTQGAQEAPLYNQRARLIHGGRDALELCFSHPVA